MKTQENVMTEETKDLSQKLFFLSMQNEEINKALEIEKNNANKFQLANQKAWTWEDFYRALEEERGGYRRGFFVGEGTSFNNACSNKAPIAYVIFEVFHGLEERISSKFHAHGMRYLPPETIDVIKIGVHRDYKDRGIEGYILEQLKGPCVSGTGTIIMMDADEGSLWSHRVLKEHKFSAIEIIKAEKDSKTPDLIHFEYLERFVETRANRQGPRQL